jgi:hypothetical protein
LQHLDLEPSVTEMILVRRISALQWDLLRMDSVDLELLSGHALRARLVPNGPCR